jgi:hypothetical protein
MNPLQYSTLPIGTSCLEVNSVLAKSFSTAQENREDETTQKHPFKTCWGLLRLGDDIAHETKHHTTEKNREQVFSKDMKIFPNDVEQIIHGTPPVFICISPERTVPDRPQSL